MANTAPAGNVTNQDKKTRFITPISIAVVPALARPTPSTAPTKVCVVEIGMPVAEAITTVVAADSSAENPRVGVR